MNESKSIDHPWICEENLPPSPSLWRRALRCGWSSAECSRCTRTSPRPSPPSHWSPTSSRPLGSVAWNHIFIGWLLRCFFKPVLAMNLFLQYYQSYSQNSSNLFCFIFPKSLRNICASLFLRRLSFPDSISREGQKEKKSIWNMHSRINFYSRSTKAWKVWGGEVFILRIFIWGIPTTPQAYSVK